ncbi:MAG: DUF4199 domain-containing protein [Marinifilaceae bacterium]
MQITQNSVWKHTFHFGALVGGLFILASLSFYLKEQPISMNEKISSINYFLTLTGIFFGVKRYRDYVLGGAITFGRALKAGVAILFVAALIYGVYIFIMMKFIDPGLLDQLFSIVRNNFEKSGFKGEQLDQFMEFYSQVTPEIYAFSEVFNKTFMGFIFSLMLAGFLRSSGNLFNQKPADKIDDASK